MKVWFAFACVGVAAVAPLRAVMPYENEVVAWRRTRVEKLTAPDDWLTLVGLHFLKDGPNTVGSAKDNDVVLTKGPARVGVVTVGAGGEVTLDVTPGADVRVNGAPIRHTAMGWES